MPTKTRRAERAPTIAFVAPSGFLRDPAAADRAARFFAARGWNVVAGDSVFSREERFAGPDELRLGELQRFATDPSVDVVMAARGGYGLSRLLPAIDFRAVKARGAVLVGYSDFTAFSLAYLARAAGVSFAGPTLTDFAAEKVDEFTAEHFFGVLAHPVHTVRFPLDGPDGRFSGRLWGSNLKMLSVLVGTPYLPRVRGGILFLEDVNEPAYAIERMLYQLLHAGLLQRQRAIVLGAFEPVPELPTDNGYALASVIARLRTIVDVPVFTGLPFGHVPAKLTLPIGGRAQLAVRDGEAELKLARYPRPVSTQC
jgi:muramoyltetrapeptide carboxypeptidase